MVTLCGVALIIFAACGVLISYHSRYDRMIIEYADFISLLRFIRERISHSSMHLSTILRQDIELDILKKLDFLSIAKEEGLYSAFCKISDKITINDEDKRVLCDCFRSIGSSMLDTEILNLTRAIDALESKYILLKEQASSKKKISGTVIICSALLVIIFII